MPSSVQSFGARVAVAQSLYGVDRNASVSRVNVFASWCLMMLDSSSTTPPNAWRQTMQAVIVGDVDTVDDISLIGALFNADTDVLPFLGGLLRHGKRRQNPG